MQVHTTAFPTTPNLSKQDAAWCFAGANSGTIYVWLASTGSLLRYWPAHFREVVSAGVTGSCQVVSD